MSQVADEKKKKTFTLGSYNAVVSLDGQMFESITVESKHAEAAMEKFVRWYTIYRSSFFGDLVFDDAEAGVESIEAVEYNEEKEPLVEGKFTTSIPTKEGEEVTGSKSLEVTFYKRFII